MWPISCAREEGGGRTFVMHDCECLVGIRMHARREPATLRVVDDEDYHVGAILIAQGMDFLQIAVVFIRQAPNVIEVPALFNVVGLVRVHQPELHIA